MVPANESDLKPMNYLAHLFLADPTPECLVGNLLGDFRTGIPIEHYPPLVQRGIQNHIQIDAYTDQHAIVKQAKTVFSQSQRRFAGIILDVLYDHYLARNWEKYSDLSLTLFTQQVYQILQTHHAILPTKLQNSLPDMIAHDWLSSYAELTTIEFTLQRIAKRFKRPTPIAHSYGEIIEHYHHFEQGFFAFFPELITYAHSLH